MRSGGLRLWRQTPRLAAAAVVCGAAVIIIRLFWPLPEWTPPPLALDALASPAPRPAPSNDRAGLTVIWQRDWRQPVVDRLPSPPPAEAPLAVQLVGTAVADPLRFALFRRADSSTIVKPVGASVDGYEIVAIERGRVRLRHGAREYDLRVPWYARIQAEQEAVPHGP